MRKRYLLPPIGFKLWKHACLTEEFQLNSKGKPFYFCPTMQGCFAGWKRLWTVKEGGRRLLSFLAPLDLMTTVNLSKLWGIVEEPGMLQSMGSQWIRRDNWTKSSKSILVLRPLLFNIGRKFLQCDETYHLKPWAVCVRTRVSNILMFLFP